MISTKEQEKIIHSAAVEFAIANHKNTDRPKGSVVLAYAEKLAESLKDSSVKDFEEHERVITSLYQQKVKEILDVLRNEKESKKTTRQT